MLGSTKFPEILYIKEISKKKTEWMIDLVDQQRLNRQFIVDAIIS